MTPPMRCTSMTKTAPGASLRFQVGNYGTNCYIAILVHQLSPLDALHNLINAISLLLDSGKEGYWKGVASTQNRHKSNSCLWCKQILPSNFRCSSTSNRWATNSAPRLCRSRRGSHWDMQLQQVCGLHGSPSGMDGRAWTAAVRGWQSRYRRLQPHHDDGLQRGVRHCSGRGSGSSFRETRLMNHMSFPSMRIRGALIVGGNSDARFLLSECVMQIPDDRYWPLFNHCFHCQSQ